MLKKIIALCLRFRTLRVAAQWLQLRPLANSYLRVFPLARVFGRSQTRYRIRSIGALHVASEIFTSGEYAGILPLDDLVSFADLGCNCGFFTCFLADALGHKNLSGLMIDANPEMVREAKWHAEVNGLENVRATWGIVGPEAGAATSEFFLHPDAAGSSRFPKSPEDRVTQNQWQRIEAPVLSLAAEWEKCFGDLPCDLLKIDIEGSEESLLEREADFVRGARLLIIEIHWWLIDKVALETSLGALSFQLEKVLSSTHDADVRLYRKV